MCGHFSCLLQQFLHRVLRERHFKSLSCAYSAKGWRPRAGGPHIHSKLRPVLDLLLAARPGARDYLSMRAYVRRPSRQ